MNERNAQDQHASWTSAACRASWRWVGFCLQRIRRWSRPGAGVLAAILLGGSMALPLAEAASPASSSAKRLQRLSSQLAALAQQEKHHRIPSLKSLNTVSGLAVNLEHALQGVTPACRTALAAAARLGHDRRHPARLHTDTATARHRLSACSTTGTGSSTTTTGTTSTTTTTTTTTTPPPAPAIQGMVVNDDNQPIPNLPIDVIANTSPIAFHGGQEWHVSTDATGHFTIPEAAREHRAALLDMGRHRVVPVVRRTAAQTLAILVRQRSHAPAVPLRAGHPAQPMAVHHELRQPRPERARCELGERDIHPGETGPTGSAASSATLTKSTDDACQVGVYDVPAGEWELLPRAPPTTSGERCGYQPTIGRSPRASTSAPTPARAAKSPSGSRLRGAGEHGECVGRALLDPMDQSLDGPPRWSWLTISVAGLRVRCFETVKAGGFTDLLAPPPLAWAL